MLGTVVTNRSCVYEETERRFLVILAILQVQTLLIYPSKFKTYKIANVLVVCMDMNTVRHFNGRT